MFEYQFSAVSVPNSLNVGDVDVYRLHHVLLCVFSFSQWDIPILDDQYCINFPYTMGIYL